MKQIIHFTFLILFLNVCFLFSPKPTNGTDFWGEYIPINKYAGFINNFDSNEFLESAISPSALMRQDYVRQSRPLYAFAASCVGYPIYYASGIFKDTYQLSLTKSMYIGYVFLNFITLLLTLLLFKKISLAVTNGKIPYAVVLMLSVFIASNFMTKAFFWTAHQQMLAFLVPLLSIYMSIYLVKGMSVKWLCMMFFMLGIGMLVYGSFLVLFTVCMVYLCYTLYKQKTFITFQWCMLIVIFCFVFVTPTVCWVLFLKYKGINYYNHEVEKYRQLVWIIDALSVSIVNFLSVFYSNLAHFLATISKLYFFLVFVFIALISRKIKTGVAFNFDNNTKLILLNLCFFCCFLIILGYYADRLTFTLMPILLCLSVANAGEMLNKKSVQVVLLLVVTTWHAVNVLSYGPFS